MMTVHFQSHNPVLLITAGGTPHKTSDRFIYSVALSPKAISNGIG